MTLKHHLFEVNKQVKITAKIAQMDIKSPKWAQKSKLKLEQKLPK